MDFVAPDLDFVAPDLDFVAAGLEFGVSGLDFGAPGSEPAMRRRRSASSPEAPDYATMSMLDASGTIAAAKSATTAALFTLERVGRPCNRQNRAAQ